MFRLEFSAAMNVSWLFRFRDSGTVSGTCSAIEIAFGIIFFVDGEWEKLQNAEIYVLYCSPNTTLTCPSARSLSLYTLRSPARQPMASRYTNYANHPV